MENKNALKLLHLAIINLVIILIVGFFVRSALLKDATILDSDVFLKDKSGNCYKTKRVLQNTYLIKQDSAACKNW